MQPPPIAPPGADEFIPQDATNAQLLATLLFKWPVSARALRLSQRLIGPGESLLALIDRSRPRATECHVPTQDCLRRLQAARELVLRSMREELAERSLLSSPLQVKTFLCLWLKDKPRECFVGLFLDAQHRLIRAEILFQGSINQTAVYPREIARRAIELNAAALIVAHNHPSGVTEPSAADRVLTQSLKTTLRTLDTPILDHLIVGGQNCFSFAEAGLL